MNFWDNLCEKYSVCEWIDDKILWYIWYKPKYSYKDFKTWKYVNWNKSKYDLVKHSIKSYPFDGTYIDEILYYKIAEIHNYFLNHPEWCGKDRLKEILRWTNIAKKLAYIINHPDDLWDHSGDILDNTYKSWTTVYVNMRNKNRFAYRYIDYQDNNKMKYSTEMYDTDQYELYIAKARKLLYTILYEKALEWYD